MSNKQLTETIKELQERFDVRLLDESETKTIFSSVRALLEENKRLREENAHLYRNNKVWQDAHKDMEYDLERAKIDRKVLEWYADKGNYHDPESSAYGVNVDKGKYASSILSQYRGDQK